MQQTILFFDLDSTLVENQFSGRAIREPLEEIATLSGTPIETLWQALEEENTRRQREDPDNLLTMDWEDMVGGLAARCGVALSKGVDELWNAYASAENVIILDNAPEVLRELQAEHRKVVLATKGLSKYQNPILDVTGLRQYFDDLLTPDITGYLKTSPNYFGRYQEQDALFIQIGDHYYDDIIAAKRNGFYAILRAPFEQLSDYDPFERPAEIHQITEHISTYPEQGSDILPDAIVISLEELPQVIAQIEAQNQS